MLKIVSSNQFKRDLKLAYKRGLKLERLQVVIDTIAAEQPLDEKYRDHSLYGKYHGFRECHIEPDWLLVYRIDSGDYYVDGSVVKLGNNVYGADEVTNYTINRTATLLGVYKINQGYADFKNIRKLYENEEYIIIDPQYTMIKPYDYIALDASKVKDNEYIYE